MNQYPELGPSELLLGFFEFYSEFENSKVIAPAKNPPFRTLDDLNEELSEKFEDNFLVFHIMH